MKREAPGRRMCALAPFFCLCLLTAPMAHAAVSGENLLFQENGARVVGFSSSAGGADVDQLLPPRTLLEQPGVQLTDFVWCTADNAPFPHWVEIEFKRKQWLTTLVFNNQLNDEMPYPGISARQVEVWAGTEAKDKLRKLASFELERNKNGQSVRIEPVEVRWLKFVIVSNWGNETWTEISAFAAYDDGSRPASLAAELEQRGKVDIYGIYFDFDSAGLREESAPALQAILGYHRAHPDHALVIEGHTDGQGSERHNLELSKNRAAAVLDALAHQGAERARFQAHGLGAVQPVADNATPEGRARNRRVTVRLATVPAIATP